MKVDYKYYILWFLGKINLKNNFLVFFWMCVPILKKCVIPTVFSIDMQKHHQFTKKLLKKLCETKMSM